jgi:hypothetical protein
VAKSLECEVASVSDVEEALDLGEKR